MIFGIRNASLKNVLVNSIVQKHLIAYSKMHLKGKVLDIGCGTSPYKDIILQYADEYIGQDIDKKRANIDDLNIESSAYKIPVGDSSFQSVLCTAVLEHLEEPEKAIRECYRLLEYGGKAIYTIPFIWHLHEEPRDFFRFSKYGITYLFSKAGFQVIELKALSGFWVTFGQLFVYNIYRLNKGPLRWFGIIAILGLLIQGLVFVLDKIDKTEKWTWMYMVVVTKTADGDG